MTCECGHSGRIHSNTDGCLAQLKDGKICPCMDTKIGIEYREIIKKKVKERKTKKGIKYTN